METKTPNLVRGRKKLRYFTNDEGAAPKIKEVFSVRDIDEFLGCASQTKLDSGFLSPLLPKGTPEAEEEEARQEAECVALPTEEKSGVEEGLTDKESPFKDSAPLKTSSPIVESTSTQEVEGEEKPLGSPLLLVDDNEDPIEGNMDKSLSVQTEDLVKEPSLIETLTLTPTKKPTVAVDTQQGDMSPALTPLKGRSHVNLTEKILASESENDIQTEIRTNEEQSSSVSPVVSTKTADAEPVVEAIMEPDSSLKASSTSNDGSFQKKLRDFLMPRNIESARMPVPPRAPSPQELDEDFFILEDEAPLLFSLKRKTQSQTSRAAKPPNKKAEAKTGPDGADGALSGTENEPGSGGTTAKATSTLQQAQAKSTAAQKKRGKQGKASEPRDEDGTSGKGEEAEGDPSSPSEAPSKAPAVQKKNGKRGKQTGKGAGAKEAALGPEGDLTEASSPSVPPPKASIAQKKRGRKGKQPVVRAEEEEEQEDEEHDKDAGNRATAALSKAQATPKKRGRPAATAAKPQAEEDADANRDSTECERRPAMAKSKAHTSTAPEEQEEINTMDYGDSPAPMFSTEVPEQTDTKKDRKNTLHREKPFLNKKAKKRRLHSSDMFSLSSSPDPKTSKAAASTTRPAKTDKSADSATVPSQSSLKTKSKKNKKGSKAEEKKRRQRTAPLEEEEDEEGGDEGQGITQSVSPLRGVELDGTGDSEARQQEPSLDLSGSSALSKRKRNKPGNWWESVPQKGGEDSAAASSPPKRLKLSKRGDGKNPKKAGKRQEKEEAAASSAQDAASVSEERTTSPAKLPRQLKDGKVAAKSRQRKVKGDGQAGQKRAQTGRGRRRKLQEEAWSAPANQAEEEEEVTSELQVNMSSGAPAPVQSSQDGEAASRANAPRPQGRQRRPPSNWWEGQQQQPEPDPEEDIIPSPSPPHPAPQPMARVPTPGMRMSELRLGRAAKPGSGSRKPRNQHRKKPTVKHAGTPKTLKGSLAAFGAIYMSDKPHGRNAVVQNVRKNLLNSLGDSSNRSNDHTSMDGDSQDRLNCDDGNVEVCDGVSNSVALDSVVQLKNGDVLPASDWPSQSLGVAGLKSGPSSMLEIQSFEDEEEEHSLPSSLRIPMALSEGDVCGPQLRPLTLVPDDWQNLTYWLRQVWRSHAKNTGQLITADHFHWYTHEGRALGHKFDLVCSSYANGKLLLGSYMRKPEQVDQHTTTVFNVYTSSVRVQIKDLKSDYNPGQAFVVPRGQSYSIRNLTPVPAILWYHRMFMDIMEDC